MEDNNPNEAKNVSLRSGRLGGEEGYDDFVNSAFAILLEDGNSASHDSTSDTKDASGKDILDTGTIIAESLKEPHAKELIGSDILAPGLGQVTMDDTDTDTDTVEPDEDTVDPDEAVFDDREKDGVITPASASVMSTLSVDDETNGTGFFDEEETIGVMVGPEHESNSAIATQAPLFPDLQEIEEGRHQDQFPASSGSGGSAIAALIAAISQSRAEGHERKSQNFIANKHLTAETTFLQSHERVLKGITALGATGCARKCAAFDLEHPDSKSLAREAFAEDENAQELWGNLKADIERFNADALDYTKIAKAAGIDPASTLATVENAQESISQTSENGLVGMFDKAGDKLSKLIEDTTAMIVERAQQIVRSVVSVMSPSPS